MVNVFFKSNFYSLYLYTKKQGIIKDIQWGFLLICKKKTLWGTQLTDDAYAFIQILK